MNKSPEAPQGDRFQLNTAKTVYFYKDNDYTFNGLKLAIHPKKYRSLDTLLTDLTDRVPGLTYGVRGIFTPRGHNNVGSLDDLLNDGRYVCSTNRTRAKGLDMDRLEPLAPWRSGKPPSGRRQHNATLGDTSKQLSPRYQAKRTKIERTKPLPSSNNILIPNAQPKKITVVKNGETTEQRTMLLNKRTAQTFEQVLSDMSEMFTMAVRQLYTIEGRKVQSLSQIFNGGNMYVASATDNFKPVSRAIVQPHPPHSHPGATRRNGSQREAAASKVKEKRNRLTNTRGKWKIWLTTNELPAAGTNSQVTLTAYGHRSHSQPIPLGYADGQHFQSGQIDEFDVSVGNIGDMYKIRINHDNTGDFPSWLCDEMRMKDVDSGEELVFSCKRWLARDEDDNEICRELPVVRPGETSLPILKYVVSVTTGDLWNSATKSNCYITIYGERGDTGTRQLYKANKDALFKQGQTDVFYVEAVSLGALKKIIIAHDGIAPGDGWFLEKVVIKESSKSQDEYVFHCGKWLDEGEGDGKIAREIKVQDEYIEDILEKKNWEIESWKFAHKNEVMFFSKSSSKALRIKNDSSIDGLGEEKDQDAIFNVVTRKGNVRVFSNFLNPSYHMAIDYNKVIGQGKGGAYCEFRVRILQDKAVLLESVKYPLQFVTIQDNGKPGEVRGLPNDPSRQFYVYCKGMFRDTGVILLGTSQTQAINIDHENNLHATGKRTRLGHFRVHKVKEGGVRMFESIIQPGQFIRLKEGKIDCNGVKDQYSQFVIEKCKSKGYVAIQSMGQRGIYIGMTTDGTVKPTVNTGAKNVFLYPEVVEFGVSKRKSIKQDTPRAVEETPRVVKEQQKKVKKNTPPSRTTVTIITQKETVVRSEKQREERREQRTETVREKRVKEEQIVREEKKVKEEKHVVKKEKTIYHDGDWSVHVGTLESVSNAEIYLVAYGANGCSGPIALKTPENQMVFEAGNEDVFKVNLFNVGKVYKIRMELHPTSTNLEPAWKVKEVKMQDLKTKELLKFKFNRWLSRQHDNGDIMAELPAVRPGQELLPILHYYVMVTTGTSPGSDTDARVYLTIFGQRGDTGNRQLLRSNNKVMFQEGQVDVFEIEAVSLGKIRECLISHDGMYTGEGWFCDQVVIRESENADLEYVFPCNKWLDTSMDDKKISRRLKTQGPSEKIKIVEEATAVAAAPQAEEEKVEAGDWRIWVTTGRESNMSTTNDVILYAYGEKNNSGPIILGSGKDGLFQHSNTDEFKVNLGSDLGELYKIRVGHSDQDPRSGWFMEKIKMKDLTTNEVLTFRLNRWMSRFFEDADIWRELPAVRPGKDPLPLYVYNIEVYTGREPGSDTDANIYVTLHGKRGDAGKRAIFQSKNNPSPFHNGQMDIFQMEAVTLDELERVVVGHDGTGPGAGWYLEKVIVKEIDLTNGREFYFPCDRWLDEGQDDKLIERTLLVGTPPAGSKGEYKLFVKTSDDSSPGANCNASITVYGEKRNSSEIDLSVQDANVKLFGAGNVDEFEIAVGDIGEIYKIRISREDNKNWDAWHVDEVKLQDKDTNETIVFHCDRWMSRDKDDFDLVRELPRVKDNTSVLPLVHYDVSVYTGERWAAGTEADVHMTLYGKKGDAGKRQLYHSFANSDKFQKGQVDKFNLEAVLLEELTHLTIGHRGSGHGAGWFLDKVTVKLREGEGSDIEYVFPCGRWLDDHEEDGITERTLRALYTLDMKALPIVIDGTKKTQGRWAVLVKTSDLHNAGTHAQVSIMVAGTKGQSKPQPLGKAGSGNDELEKGKEANFTITVGDIGDVQKIRLEHDNTNSFPAWHVDSVKLIDQDTGEELVFYLDRWLAEDEDDGQLVREVAASRSDGSTLPVLRYVVVVETGKQANSGTSADVLINLIGQSGDTGIRPLKDCKTSKTPFTSGSADVFILEAASVGALEKIQLSHNGTSKENKSWFVEKVIVYESPAALMETVFHCQDWIEKEKNETIATKDIFMTTVQRSVSLPVYMAQPNVRSVNTSGSWTATVKTGEQSAEVTNDVNMIVCGTLGNTEPKLLNSAGPFKPGFTEEIPMLVGAIGKIFKVRLYFGGEQPKASWFLQKLILKDKSTLEELVFNYNGLLEVTDKNPDGSVDLPATRPDIPPLQDTKYSIKVFTGGQLCAETEANVFCKLIGQWGDSGRMPLVDSLNNPEPFKRGQMDEFQVSLLDLGHISQVEVSHDTVGRGRGWFCEKVVIRTADSPVEQVFPCFRWMDTGCDDRLLLRELLPLAQVPISADQENEQIKPSKGVWQCMVKTADTEKLAYHTIDSSQSRHVSIVMYGDQGTAGPLELDNGHNNVFLPGNIAKFMDLRTDEIGEVYKVRVSAWTDGDPDAVWMIEEVTMQDEDSEETLKFDFSRWIGEMGGDIRKELPAIRSVRNILPVITYRIAVHTSSEESDAGTISEAHLTIYGSRGDSGRRHLAVNERNTTKFQAGQEDVFMLEAVHLGEIEKLVIAKGPGDPWFLDKVEVKEGPYAPVTNVFVYNRWIGSPSEQSIEFEETLQLTDVLPSSVALPIEEADIKEIKTKGNWTVQTVTGEQPGSGSWTDVVVVICGDEGETTPLPLKSDEDQLFQPKETNNFNISIKEQIGDIFKVRIGFENNQEDKSWFLEKIKFQDTDSADQFSYEFNDWIRVNDELDGWREFPAQWPAIFLPPVTIYEVSVATGDVSKAGTDANVYIEIYGEQGGTGRRYLKHSHNNTNKFEQNQVDVFEIEAVSMLNLQRVIVGHDGKGIGSGWFLKRIVIKETTDPDKEFIFECDRWLDEGEDDFLLERELLVTAAEPDKPDDAWTVTIVTGGDSDTDRPDALLLTIYGEEGQSQPLALNGQDEKFDVIVTDTVGEVYKIRIGYADITKDPPALFIDYIKLHDEKSDRNYLFTASSALKVSDDVDHWREFPVVTPNSEDVLAVHSYQVQVFTGDVSKAGTDANVFIQIFGERGDTGTRRLLKSKTNYDKFELGNMDLFEIEAVDLGKLTKVTVHHDGQGIASGWFLEKILIKESESATSQYLFQCDRWLDEGEDDFLIKRDLPLTEVIEDDVDEAWKVWTTTGKSEDQDGNSAAIAMVIYGDKGQSEILTIGGEETNFKEGATDEFDVKSKKIGELYKVRVGFAERSSSRKEWVFKNLKFQRVSYATEYRVDNESMIMMDETHDSWREFPVTQDPQSDTETLNVHQYQVEVYTGDISGAGTDAVVTLEIYGERGDTGKRELLISKTNENKFEQGAMDVFDIEAVDLKKLTKVKAAHDGAGIGSGWYLDKVIIKESENSEKKYLFECDRWLDEGEDDHLLERVLELTEVIEEDDPPAGDWQVLVTTSDEENSGTDADVFLTIYGDKGKTEQLPLGGEQDQGYFETGKTDEFNIPFDKDDVGDIVKIRLEHNNVGLASGWRVEKLVLKNKSSGEQIEFPINRWLSFEDKLGDIAIEVSNPTKGEEALTVNKYIVQVFTSKDFGSGTDADVYIKLTGANGDSGSRFLKNNVENKNKFEKGKTDTFHIEAVNLGKLEKILIGHDGSGAGAGWKLDKVTIKENEAAKEKYVFLYGKWLDSGRQDKVLEKELPLTKMEKGK